MKLCRYWIEFRQSMDEPHPPGTPVGCGVTAYGRDDALLLLERRVFNDVPLPEILRFEQDIHIDDLDQKHVVPNMSSPSKRGIWFPLGYE